MTRIRISIDRITAGRPGLDRGALERALRAELAQVAAEGGFGAVASRATVHATLPTGSGPLPNRIAAAVVKGIKP